MDETYSIKRSDAKEAITNMRIAGEKCHNLSLESKEFLVQQKAFIKHKAKVEQLISEIPEKLSTDLRELYYKVKYPPTDF